MTRRQRVLSGRTISILALCAWGTLATGAAAENQWPYDPSLSHPFGMPNPAQTDSEARVFDRLIGAHECVSQRHNYQTGESVEAPAMWTWYYNMNGYGVRDVFRLGESAPASQRVYNPGTKEWHVWYMLGQKFFFAGEWTGGGKGDDIVLESEGAKLGDKDVISRLEFYDIKKSSFKWRSGNVDLTTGKNLFYDWEISCTRRS